MHNLDQLLRDASNVMDDNVELKSLLSTLLTKPWNDAKDWLAKIENDFAEKSTEHYVGARKQKDPEKRKAALLEVTNRMELHQRLLDKLVELGQRANNGADTPLVAHIKHQITNEERETVQILSGRCSVKQIAESIHGIYVTATDLANVSILAHAETCIAAVLQASGTHQTQNTFGIRELGIALERDLPRGGEIVANMPQFAEFTLLAFQEMTAGKSVGQTINEVEKLNKLSPQHATQLLKSVNDVYQSYNHLMSKNKFHVDLPGMVHDIRDRYTKKENILDVIGGVFAVWSLESATELCLTLRRPLPAQVVAIVRLLGLDKSKSRLRTWANIIGVESWWKTKCPLDSSHLVEVRSDQNRTGKVCGARSRVNCSELHWLPCRLRVLLGLPLGT